MGSLLPRHGWRGERGVFLLALAVVALVVALELAIGSSTVLVELLVAGPLVAATRLSAARTALVGVLATAVALPLGEASDAFGSADHAAAVVVVAVGSILAAVVAALHAARESDASRLEVQYRVARVLAEARALDEAAPALLESIGRPLGWRAGHLWTDEGGDTLRCVAAWREEGAGFEEFVRATAELDPRAGVGLPGRVWESGESAWLHDAVQDANFPRAEAAARAGLHGALGFPITSGDRCVGVVELFSSEPREPDPALIALTRALGAQIGEFVERQRAADAMRESEARKAAVLASSLDGVITIDHTGRVIEWNPAAERIFQRRTADVVGRELGELIVPPSLRERHRAALARYVDTGEARVLDRRIELTGMRADGSEFPVELAITRIGTRAPPVFTGTVRDITDRVEAEREREQLLILEQLARRDADHAREQLEAILRGVADAITAQASDGRLLFANDAAVEMLGFQSSAALLSAPPGDVLRRFEVFTEDGEPFPLDELPGRRALAEGVPGDAVVRFRVRGTGEEHWSAVKATPIKDSDGQVTMAINVIEDITTLKRAEFRQRVLAQSSGVLSASLDPDALLREVASLAVPELADWCAVDLREDSGAIKRVALAHTDADRLAWAEELRRRYPPDPRATQGAPNVLRTGAGELYPEITDQMLQAAAVDDEHLGVLREVGMRSAIVAPMSAHGHTVGALTLVTGTSGRRFDEADLQLAEELGRRCATAIENARLYTERAYIARTLQESLLPAELPEIPGIEAAARFRPTGDGNDVGGDFYDMFATGARGWTVVMGDVCGKGPDAAAVTALARYTLRAAAMREGRPSRGLRVLNEAMLRQRDDRRFCTVVSAYLELHEGRARVQLAIGGHPLPLHLRAGGTIAPAGAPGTLLGVVADPDLEDRSVELEPGDALVFYTDGVVERRGDGAGLDEAALSRLVADCAGRDADAIAAAIEAAALRSIGGRPRDDIAVLVLRVTS